MESRVEVGLLSDQCLDHLQVLLVCEDPVGEDLFIFFGLPGVTSGEVDIFQTQVQGETVRVLQDGGAEIERRGAVSLLFDDKLFNYDL